MHTCSCLLLPSIHNPVENTKGANYCLIYFICANKIFIFTPFFIPFGLIHHQFSKASKKSFLIKTSRWMTRYIAYIIIIQISAFMFIYMSLLCRKIPLKKPHSKPPSRFLSHVPPSGRLHTAGGAHRYQKITLMFEMQWVEVLLCVWCLCIMTIK